MKKLFAYVHRWAYLLFIGMWKHEVAWTVYIGGKTAAIASGSVKWNPSTLRIFYKDEELMSNTKIGRQNVRS